MDVLRQFKDLPVGRHHSKMITCKHLRRFVLNLLVDAKNAEVEAVGVRVASVSLSLDGVYAFVRGSSSGPTLGLNVLVMQQVAVDPIAQLTW